MIPILSKTLKSLCVQLCSGWFGTFEHKMLGSQKIKACSVAEPDDPSALAIKIICGWCLYHWKINTNLFYFPHRNTEQLKLEETSGSRLVQLPCPSRATWSWLSRRLLKISTLSRQPESLLSQPDIGKSVPWCSDGPSYVCAYSLLPCHRTPLKWAWLHLLYTLHSGIAIHWWIHPLEPSLFSVIPQADMRVVEVSHEDQGLQMWGLSAWV